MQDSQFVKQVRSKLIEWLPKIKDEIRALRLDDEVFWTVQEILNGPRFERLSGVYPRFMFNNFATSAAVAVRRQVKHNKDSVSLMALLIAVKNCPQVVSRQSYLGLFADTPELVDSANAYFDEIAGAGEELIPLKVIDQQIAELQDVGKRIEHFVDRRVAHTDKRGVVEELPTLADLTAAWKTLEKLVLVYLRLLTAVAPSDLHVPLGQWLDIFEIPWVQTPGVDADGFRLDSGGHHTDVDFEGR